MNLIEAIAHHLETVGLGEVDRDLFWGRMPDQPDDCACVFCTDSGRPGDDKPARIQIITRSRSTRRAFERSEAIAEALDDEHCYLCWDDRWAEIESINTSAGLGADDKTRELYASNYYVHYCG